MNGRMNDWLAAARADTAARTPDALVETQLLARVRERRALQSVATARGAADRGTRASWWRRLMVGAPVAIAAALVVLLITPGLAPLPESAPTGRDVATPFIALVASDVIAAERAPVVVPTEVARASLAEYGLPVDPARADEPLNAEFLVSRTGVVLAVRFRE